MTNPSPKTHAHALALAADPDEDAIAKLRARCARVDIDVGQVHDDAHTERCRLRETRLANGWPDPDVIPDTRGLDPGTHRAFARGQEWASDAPGASGIRRCLKAIERLEREAHRLVLERDYLRGLIDNADATLRMHNELAGLSAVSFDAFVASMLADLRNVAAARAALDEAVQAAVAKLDTRTADAERAKVLATALRVEAPEVRCLPAAAALALLPAAPAGLTAWVAPSTGPRARQVAEVLNVGSWFHVISPVVTAAIASYAPTDDALVAALIDDPVAFDRHCRDAVDRAENEQRARREAIAAAKSEARARADAEAYKSPGRPPFAA